MKTARGLFESAAAATQLVSAALATAAGTLCLANGALNVEF